jgi:hypothetical protein
MSVMEDDFFEWEKMEKLKEENDFMKIKLMLEHGAQFGSGEAFELPPEIEHEFLKNIMAFEKQFDNHKTILLFDKIGKPSHFKPAGEINDATIGNAWKQLSDFLREHDIDLSVCSPNISDRELYRFTTEELFKLEIDDMELRGFVNCFVYDEFHPDPVYESERTLKEQLFPALFSSEAIGRHLFCFVNEKPVLNGKTYACSDDITKVLNQFKSFYDQLSLEEMECSMFHVSEEQLVTVPGRYKAVAVIAGDHAEIKIEGNFVAELRSDECGYWFIHSLNMEGIRF